MWLDDVTRADMAQLMMSADRVLAHVGTWKHVVAREEDWRCMVAHDVNVENCSGAWRHVKCPMKMIFSQKGRSKRLLSDGAICGLIGEAEVVMVARQWSLMY